MAVTRYEHGVGTFTHNTQFTITAQTLDADADLICFWLGYYNTTNVTVTGVEWGDGTNWSSMTQLDSYAYNWTGTEYDRGYLFYLKNPDVNDSQFRVTMSSAVGVWDSRRYGYLAVGGADVSGTEAELFPNTLLEYLNAEPGTSSDTFTGGASGDQIVVGALSWQSPENNSLDLNNQSQTIIDSIVYADNSEAGQAAKDWSSGATAEAVGDYLGAFKYHVAQAASSGTDYTLVSASGSYTYTGTAASLESDRTVTANAGSYSYTGTAADLTYANKISLTAESGSYTYTGTAAEFSLTSTLAADSGSYTYTGTAAEFNLTATLSAESGSYTSVSYTHLRAHET